MPHWDWPRTTRHIAGGLACAAVLVASLAIGYGGAGALLVGFAVLTPIERIFRRHPYRIRRPGFVTDVVFGFSASAFTIFGGALGVALLLPALPLAVALLPIRHEIARQPFALLAVEAMLAADALAYFSHWLLHRVPWLWRFHSVHHASEQLDWLAGLRIHPVDVAVTVACFGPLFALGLDPRIIGGVFATARAVTNAWSHLNVRWRLRALQPLVLTPEFHRWHHSAEPEAVGKNLSTGLPVWDLVFGTYYLPADRRPEVYGVRGRPAAGFLTELSSPFRHRVAATAAAPESASVA